MSTATATDTRTVALVLNADGSVYDEVFNVSSGVTYANEGYEVRAVAKDGSISKARAQRMYDQELANYKDCFGL